ncbi:MAG: HDIG domain-containing protein [Nitrospinae bacterium]|nr:HDIG domain-containing protein [Nitrospinota bacterium]
MPENSGASNPPQTPPPPSKGIEELKKVFQGRGRLVENLRDGLADFFAGNKRFHTAVLLAVFCTGLAIFIKPNRVATEEYREGEIARRNIYAPRDQVIDDAAGTEARRTRAQEEVRDVYMLDTAPLKAATGRIRNAFGAMKQGYLKNLPQPYKAVMKEIDEREAMDVTPLGGEAAARRAANHEALRQFEAAPRFAALERQFRDTLGLEMLSPETLAMLRANHYRPLIAEWLAAVLTEAMQGGIVPQKDIMPVTAKGGIDTVDAETGARLGKVDYRDVMDLKGAQAFARRRLGEMMMAQPLSLQRAVEEMTAGFLGPNMAYNRMMTMDMRKSAVDAVAPVQYRIQKGELLLREGERVTPDHLIKVAGLKRGLAAGGSAQAGAASAAFLMLIIAATAFYMKNYMGEFAARRSNVALLGLFFITQALLLRIFHTLAGVFSAHNPDIALDSYLYAAPFAFVPLMGAIFFTREVAMILVILVSLSAGIIFNPAPDFIFFSFFTGLVAVFHVGHIKRRSDVWKAGVRLIAAAIAAIAVLEMADGAFFTAECLNNMLFAILGGMFVVALTLALPPLIESWFPVVSDIRLLELQDLNHPLLARMAMVAPGTYHHSIVVGNLAEDAAEVIGANPLLARVGSYFHDIGKMHKPEYFIENQREGVNRHDSLTPYMSVLIITSHVTKGLEWAREYRLIPQIQDIIAEHHGTQVIQYFYHRAKEQEGAAISEQNFRYPGRKPQSRESAIVALADAVEASSRTLKNPTSSRLRALVSKIINDKFVSGQLDESHLTLHDLNKIGDSFVRILHGIFHYRIEYPGDKDEDDADDDRKTGGEGSEPKPPPEKTGPNLRRIG